MRLLFSFSFGLFLTTLVTDCNAQLTVLGACPNAQAMPHINFPRYQGVWFEVEKYLFLPEITGSCVYVHYKDFQPENVTFKADIMQVDALTRQEVGATCDGKLGPEWSADIDLIVHIPVPFSLVPLDVSYPFYILDTDYETYSIKWRCKQVLTIAGVANLQTLWILSRKREYPSELQHHVHEILKRSGISPQKLVRTDQTNCPMPRILSKDAKP